MMSSASFFFKDCTLRDLKRITRLWKALLFNFKWRLAFKGGYSPQVYHKLRRIKPMVNTFFWFFSDKSNLHFGCIICMFGVRYRSYCSNIVRTLMVNPTEKMQDIYTFLVDCEEYLFEQLKPGLNCLLTTLIEIRGLKQIRAPLGNVMRPPSV